MNINRLLFEMIGLLMLTIVGIGTGAVKTNVQSTSSPFSVGTLFKDLVTEPVGTVSETKSAVSGVSSEVSKGGTSESTSVSSQSRETDDGDDEEGDDDGDENNSASSQVVKTTVKTGTGQTSSSGSTGASTQAAGTYTLAQIAKHNNASSCYTTVSGGVYDLTSFITMHPGGEQAILSLCGIDGTAAFTNQHGGQRRPEQELASLKIGVLVK